MDDRDVWRDAMQRALEAGTHEERAALVAWATEWRLGTEGAARPAKPAKRRATGRAETPKERDVNKGAP